MAYNYNSFNRNQRPQYDRTRNYSQPPKELRALPLPEDYVDAAEAVMRKLIYDDRVRITTSKIRNLLSMVSDIYNEENLRDEPELLPKSKAALTMMRIRVVYEAGRDPQAVKRFVEEAKLLEYIKGIKSDKEALIAFAHYMEALVAYHRFFGGKEN